MARLATGSRQRRRCRSGSGSGRLRDGAADAVAVASAARPGMPSRSGVGPAVSRAAPRSTTVISECTGLGEAASPPRRRLAGALPHRRPPAPERAVPDGHFDEAVREVREGDRGDQAQDQQRDPIDGRIQAGPRDHEERPVPQVDGVGPHAEPAQHRVPQHRRARSRPRDASPPRSGRRPRRPAAGTRRGTGSRRRRRSAR